MILTFHMMGQASDSSLALKLQEPLPLPWKFVMQLENGLGPPAQGPIRVRQARAGRCQG